jgi:hypothetical protein
MLSDLYITSKSTREPLKIGLLLNEMQVPRYVYQVIEDITRSNFAVIRLTVMHQQPQPYKAALYSWYSQFDVKHYPLHPDPFELIDASSLLTKVPSLPSEAIPSHNLDVIFHFGSNILEADLLKSARYGIWSFHYGDNDFYRGGPPYFWELVEDASLSGVILQVLTGQPYAGPVLAKIQFPTLPGLSQQSNRWAPYLGSTHMVIQKLHELHENGWDFVLAKCIPTAPYQGKRNPYQSPTNVDMVCWLAPRVTSKALTKPFRKTDIVWHWRLGLRVGGQAIHASACDRCPADVSGFRWLESPKGYNWADPFFLQKNGTLWLFFEDYIYGEGRAIIRVAPVNRDGTLGEIRTCLDLGYHTSYPYVFEHQGEIFMLPETLSNRTVELYRATSFPYQWRLEKVLFQGDVTDTSPWFDGERWWFFTCVEEPKGIIAQCLLFSADSLTGDWKAHPANPISSDVRFARNAGAIFSKGGQTFRPTQNCAGNYGRSMSLREIVAINPDQYVERGALDIEPDPAWNYIGLHTYNFSGDVEVIDGMKIEPANRYR